MLLRLRRLNSPLMLTSTLEEMFWSTCMQSHLKTSSQRIGFQWITLPSVSRIFLNSEAKKIYSEKNKVRRSDMLSSYTLFLDSEAKISKPLRYAEFHWPVCYCTVVHTSLCLRLAGQLTTTTTCWVPVVGGGVGGYACDNVV